jgi:hypothetical protein
MRRLISSGSPFDAEDGAGLHPLRKIEIEVTVRRKAANG